MEKLEGFASIFCSNPGVDKGILEPQRLARSFTLNHPFTLKRKENAVAPLPGSSVDDTTDRIVSSSEEATGTATVLNDTEVSRPKLNHRVQHAA